MFSDQATPARSRRRGIALVAHDRRKQDLTEWARFNRRILARHCLYATGTTGRLLHEELGLPVTCFRSGRAVATRPSANEPGLDADAP